MYEYGNTDDSDKCEAWVFSKGKIRLVVWAKNNKNESMDFQMQNKMWI